MILLGFFAVLFFSPFHFAARKVRFNKSAILPANQGYVTIEKNRNKYYLINIKVINLAGIENMESSGMNYAVWMESDRGETEKMGTIFSSTGSASNKLRVNMDTESASPPSKVFITAESDIDVQCPGSRVVLTTNKFKTDLIWSLHL